MLLELGDGGPVERVMAGVVDPRRELVNQGLSVHQEELHRHHPDVLQRVQEPRGDLRHPLVGAGRLAVEQDAFQILVARREVEPLVPLRVSGRDERGLRVEIHILLYHVPGAVGESPTSRRSDPDVGLTLPIVAAADRLDHGPAHPLGELDGLRTVARHPELRGGKPVVPQELLLERPVRLEDDGVERWAELSLLMGVLQDADVDVLELRRDDVASVHKLRVFPHRKGAVGDPARGPGVIGQDVVAMPQLPPLKDHHPAELARSQDSDIHRGPWSAQGTASFRTPSVCCFMYRASASASSLREVARIRTARSAALPAAPMATVATGTPRGIWTIERRESRPARCRLGTGTPMTGSVVREAIIPGRWAAPPAPAMITWMPRSAAPRA